jgi:transcriptional regulator with XRE-family HTH domain
MPSIDHSLVRDRRDELDLSNRFIAEQCGISEGYANNVLNGRDNPSRRLIYRLARVLALPFDQIVTDDQAKRCTRRSRKTPEREAA